MTEHDRLTVVKGSVLSEEDMNRAFAAAGTPVDAVLQCLNAPRANEWNPWAAFLGPPRLLADATANATRALRQQQQQRQASTQPDAGSTAPKPRLVVMSALGTGESRKVAPALLRLAIDHSNIGKTYADHEAVDAEIEANCGDEVRWTVMLAVGLQHAGVQPVRTFGHTQAGASLFVTRESCARWMVDVASGAMGDEFDNRRVIVSN